MSKILFIFEGESTEPTYFEAIKKYFKFEDDIISIFGGSIYQMYNCIQKDPELDIFELVKERECKRTNSPSPLKDVLRKDISEIFIFFDHDGHDSNAASYKLKELLETFDESTEQGHLYISYPMVESLIDIKLDNLEFKNKLALISQNKQYKKKTKENNKLTHIGNISREQWGRIFQENLKKANWIISENYILPMKLGINQYDIFNSQESKFIQPHGQVAILSAYPLFIDDYFREEFLFYRNDVDYLP
jgi:hypothetical protein